MNERFFEKFLVVLNAAGHDSQHVVAFPAHRKTLHYLRVRLHRRLQCFQGFLFLAGHSQVRNDVNDDAEALGIQNYGSP